MAVTIKKISLWRAEVPSQPGALAGVLEPLAHAGADLQVVMSYRYPGHESKGAIEVYPVSGKKAAAGAGAAGLSSSAIPCLMVQGDNKPGLGHAIAKSLADAGINISFQMAQVIGRRFSAVFAFESDADAKQAAGLIRKAAGRARR
jgi:hypothetical protein